MSSQAAVKQRGKAEQGYLTIISWHTQGEAGLLLRGHDKWQTTDDEGVCLRKSSKNARQCNLSVKQTAPDINHVTHKYD